MLNNILFAGSEKFNFRFTECGELFDFINRGLLRLYTERRRRPCSMAWDPVPEQVWLLKLLRKPAFNCSK